MPEEYNSFKEFDEKLKEITEKYSGKTVREILEELEIPYIVNNTDDVSKLVSERIITKMFGANKSKIRDNELFAEVGIIGKSIVLTSKGGQKEDTKFFTFDFTEIKGESLEFKNSPFYEYFNQNHFCILYLKSKKEKTNY